MSREFGSVAEVLASVGQELGESEWLVMTQERINQFANATGDHQWIHVDPVRAATGPFGACVAHGYLTQSLVNLFLPQIVHYQALKMGVNYGCDKVRFPAPVKVGSRIRGVAQTLAAEPLAGNGVQVSIRVTVQIEGGAKPGCVVDTISRTRPRRKLSRP